MKRLPPCLCGIALLLSALAPVSAAADPGSPLATTYEFRVTPNIVESLLPLPPRPPVNVAVASRIIFTLAPDVGSVASVRWYKNGAAIATGGLSYTIADATAADSGNYSVEVQLVDGTLPHFDPVQIRVEAALRQRLLNLSTRATISPAQRFFISGLVIAPSPGSLGENKAVIIRGVGPSLAQFGVTDALPDPEIHVFNSAGTEVPPSPSVALYPYPITAVLRAIGAFPLLDGSDEPQATYVLAGGAYSVRLSSKQDRTGTALLEIYEVPQ